MVYLSEVLIANPQFTSFDELLEGVGEIAKSGEMHLHFNIKPPYPDTPENWEDRIEAAFSARF